MYPIITGRKINIALVGCGRVSRNHFEAIKKHSVDLNLCAVCDDNPDVLAKICEEYNVPGYSDLESMLAASDADLVSICTPSGLHSNMTIMCAQAGRNVITEKPMATRWGDALNMVAACDAANRRLFVVKQNRRNKTLQLLKKAIQEKRFGRIYMVHLNVFWSRPQHYYDSAEWRGTWEMDGGAFMNQASH